MKFSCLLQWGLQIWQLFSLKKTPTTQPISVRPESFKTQRLAVISLIFNSCREQLPDSLLQNLLFALFFSTDVFLKQKMPLYEQSVHGKFSETKNHHIITITFMPS